MEKKESKQGTGRYQLLKNDFFINRIAGKYIFNSVISMISLYAGSLIDTLIVGMFLDEEGLAAMSLVSPVYLVYYTVGATIGIGASILGSRMLGKGDGKGYRNVFTSATLLMAAAFLIMTVGGFVFLRPISRLLAGSAGEEQAELVRQYLLYYIPAGGFNLLAYIPMYFLKTDGKPKVTSRLFTLSAVTNVVFSYLFMCPLVDMGIGGASLATALSNLETVVIGFPILLTHSTELKLVRHSFSKKNVREMIVAGVPNGLSNLLESARIVLINTLLMGIGAAALLPCYTVVRNISDLLSSVLIGISSALLPLIGIYFGERDYEGERSVIRRSERLGLYIMLPLVLLVCVIPRPIFLLFGVTDESLIREGMWAIPLSCIGLLASYLNILYSSYLTSIKREAFATIMVALRLFIMLAVSAVPLAYTLGSVGIWASLSLAEILSLAAYFCIVRVLRKKKPTLDRFLLDTSKESAGDIVFSVQNEEQDIVNASEKIALFCEEQEIDMKRTMRVSLAIEEILTFLLSHCLGKEKTNYIDVRVCRLGEEVMIRFRYIGKIFDPISFYEENEGNEEMEEELLGIKMMTKSASLTEFKQTMGANNLMMIF